MREWISPIGGNWQVIFLSLWKIPYRSNKNVNEHETVADMTMYADRRSLSSILLTAETRCTLSTFLKNRICLQYLKKCSVNYVFAAWLHVFLCVNFHLNSLSKLRVNWFLCYVHIQYLSSAFAPNIFFYTFNYVLSIIGGINFYNTCIILFYTLMSVFLPWYLENLCR